MQKPAIVSWSLLSLLVGCFDDSADRLPPIETDFACQPATCDRACDGGKLDGSSLVTPVDRARGLRADWAPSDLVELPRTYRTAEGSTLRLRAAAAFIELADAAYVAGHDLYCGSSYRSFESQCLAYSVLELTEGCQVANAYSASAGHSEHQLGTACDVFDGDAHVAADSPASYWLDAHAHEYGFVLSYPAGSECETQYAHEPWHFRYVGRQAAGIMKSRDISTLQLAEEMTPDKLATIEADAAETPEAVALLCSRYERTGLLGAFTNRCR